MLKTLVFLFLQNKLSRTYVYTKSTNSEFRHWGERTREIKVQIQKYLFNASDFGNHQKGLLRSHENQVMVQKYSFLNLGNDSLTSSEWVLRLESLEACIQYVGRSSC